jgi:hypothetical protein
MTFPSRGPLCYGGSVGRSEGDVVAAAAMPTTVGLRLETPRSRITRPGAQEGSRRAENAVRVRAQVHGLINRAVWVSRG